MSFLKISIVILHRPIGLIMQQVKAKQTYSLIVQASVSNAQSVMYIVAIAAGVFNV